MKKDERRGKKIAGGLTVVIAVGFLVAASAAVGCTAIGRWLEVRACHRFLDLLSPPPR